MSSMMELALTVLVYSAAFTIGSIGAIICAMSFVGIKDGYF